MGTEESSSKQEVVRRPIAARGTRWAAGIARALANAGIRPNAISKTSVVFAALAGLCLILVGQGSSLWFLVMAAMAIQLRLLCNLFDGMVAVEGGFRSKSGEVYNDLPDRLSDPLILIPAGYVMDAPYAVELGWLAGLFAILTAYVRVLGGACGLTQKFQGPMAKQHRMAVMTLACLLTAVEMGLGRPPWVMYGALVLILLGCAITVCRRTMAVIRDLEAR